MRPSRTVMTVAIASIAPDAQRQWPIIDLIEETGISRARDPRATLSAAVSAESFCCGWIGAPASRRLFAIQQECANGRVDQHQYSSDRITEDDFSCSEERQVNHSASENPGQQVAAKVVGRSDIPFQRCDRSPPANVRTDFAVEGTQCRFRFCAG